MKPPDEELVNLFVDGALAGDELAAFEARLKDEPELVAAVEAAAGEFALGDEIREAFDGGDVVGHDVLMAATSLSHSEIPKPELFNAKVLSRVTGKTPGTA